jgi:hypothetical protein
MMRALKPRAPRHPAALAEVAFKELLLSTDTWTRADRDRLGRMWRGLTWLDNDQADLRASIDDLLEAWTKTRGGERATAALVACRMLSRSRSRHRGVCCVNVRSVLTVAWGGAVIRLPTSSTEDRDGAQAVEQEAQYD